MFEAELYTIKDDETGISGEHSHAYHELYFLLDGHARHFINNEILDISVGEAAFVWQGYIHKVIYNAEQCSHRLLVSFSSDFVGEPYVRILRDLGRRKQLSLDADVSTDVRALLLTLYREKTEQREHHLLQCQNLLQQILVLLHRHSKQRLPQPQTISPNEMVIQQAAQYLSAHYAERLTLPWLAQNFGMSESHFSRTFKAYTGIGVAQYLKHIRLRAAEKMLIRQPVSVTEVAFACGFNNSNYFICEFKKRYGITPLQYAISAHKE